MNRAELIEWLEAEIKKIEDDPRFHYGPAIEQATMNVRRHTLIEMRDKLTAPPKVLLDRILDIVRECLDVADKETVDGTLGTEVVQQGIGSRTFYVATVRVGGHEAKHHADDEFGALYGAALKAVGKAFNEVGGHK